MLDRIFTIEDKCTGCNKCIAACPVDCANQVYRAYDGTRKVYVDNDYCIHCGACLRACDHGARDYTDDTERFFLDLAKGIDEPITLVAAPAAQIHFPQLGKLFGWFKSLGIQHVYDVSLGADIATWSYLKAREELGISSMIAQPCPVIVNYCERYMPELMKSLAPIQSPLICLAIYLRHYENLKGRIVFLSPCIAKSEEIEDPNTGNMVQYNITFSKLKRKIQSEGIDLSSYPDVGFEGMPSGIGHVYSRPGGLMETIRVTDENMWIRPVDAVFRVYPYLAEYLARRKAGKAIPDVVDILNCEGGCNLGTGTDRDISEDDIDCVINQRKQKKLEEQVRHGVDGEVEYAPQKYFDENLHWKDFTRYYTDRKIDGRFVDEELEGVYQFLHKRSPESREINCHACGYGSCKRFAQALKKGMNVAESCIDHERSRLKMDLLTNLLNHGGLGDAMENFLRWYNNTPYPLGLIMMDVDDFKNINDSFGHDVGDIALQEVANVIRDHMRPTDAAGRWGGDEFMLILPHTEWDKVKSIAEGIQRRILSSDVLPNGFHFSSSVGIAMAVPGDTTVTFFQRADQALYESKQHKGERK